MYWYIDLKLAEIFQNWVTYIVLRFCQKKSLIQFFDDVIAYAGFYCTDIRQFKAKFAYSDWFLEMLKINGEHNLCQLPK